MTTEELVAELVNKFIPNMSASHEALIKAACEKIKYLSEEITKASMNLALQESMWFKKNEDLKKELSSRDALNYEKGRRLSEYLSKIGDLELAVRIKDERIKELETEVATIYHELNLLEEGEKSDIIRSQR